MKNRTVGLIYFGLDVVFSTVVLVSVSFIVNDPVLHECTMYVVLPILANAPSSLIAVPWIKVLAERTEWVLLIFALSLGCLQNYFVGWITAWAFKHRKGSGLWGWILLIIFVIWSAFIGFIFFLSLIMSLGCIVDFFG